ncbi:unnamed protein product, partial [marine sediment metagenome]
LTITTAGSGSVTKVPDQATYTYGETVDLTAAANAGWTFSVWSGDLGGSTNPETITMDGNKSVTATFTEDQYTLTITTAGSGSVTKVPDQAMYTYGQTVDLTAVAGVGWTFSAWSGDLAGSTNPETITMDGNKSVTATFTLTIVPPTITSTSVTNATVNQLYSYDVDANGIPAPTYSLLTSPADMTINATTGLIEWTPTEAQLGLNAVTVRATNSEGTDDQSFDIDVAGIVPLIISTPVTAVFVGELYSYDVDANGIPAPTYLLLTSPAGMTINA